MFCVLDWRSQSMAMFADIFRHLRDRITAEWKSATQNVSRLRLTNCSKSSLSSSFHFSSQNDKLVLDNFETTVVIKDSNVEINQHHCNDCLHVWNLLAARTHWKRKMMMKKRHRKRFSIIFSNFVEVLALNGSASPSSYRNIFIFTMKI